MRTDDRGGQCSPSAHEFIIDKKKKKTIQQARHNSIRWEWESQTFGHHLSRPRVKNCHRKCPPQIWREREKKEGVQCGMASPADLCRLISDVSMVPTRSLTPSQCEYPLADPPFEHTLVAIFFFFSRRAFISAARWPGWVVHKLCARRAIYDESELKRADLWPGPAIPLRWAHSMSNCVWRFPSDIDTPHGCHSTFRKWYRICAAQRAFHSNWKEENDDPIAVAKGTGCKFSFLLICSSVLCVCVIFLSLNIFFFFSFFLPCVQ